MSPRSPPPGSAAGAAILYNLRLSTEGLRQGHGPPWSWPAPGFKGYRPCRRPLRRAIRLKTAKHHLNPVSGEAKNGHSQGCEVAPLEPLKEKKKAPVRRQKTWHNLARTNPKRQPLGNGSETAKHHLNPVSGEAKNGHSQGGEVAPLEPLKEKKKAPVRRQKTWHNLARTNPKRQPLGNGSETAKHHLNPVSGEAKNGHSQGGEVAPLEPLKEKKKAPVQPSPDKPKAAASWQWIRNSQTPPKSGLRQSEKRSFAGWRSGTFGAPKGEEKSPST